MAYKRPTEKLKQEFLEAYRQVPTIAGASAIVQQRTGTTLDRRRVLRWLEGDREFAERLKEIDEEVADQLVAKLIEVANTGDRQAIMALLKKLRPEEFGDEGQGTTIVQVISSIPRPEKYEDANN